MGRKYGIWSGRFQIVHKAYEWYFMYNEKYYNEKCIVIVNPDPNNPPDDTYPSFSRELNPLTYFDRMVIWKKLSDSLGQKVIIIPAWHPIKYLVLENYFLPPRGHCEWLLPMILGHWDDKPIGNYEAREDLCLKIEDGPDNIKAIRDFCVWNSVKKGNVTEFENYLPSSIIDLTKKLLGSKDTKYQRIFKNKGDDCKYIIVPVIDEHFNSMLIDYSIEYTSKLNNSMLVFALSVNISESKKWWFEKAVNSDREDKLTYFDRYIIIKNTMENIGFNNYVITPCFFKQNSYSVEFSNAFLPYEPSNRIWMFDENDKITNKMRFKIKRMEINIKYLSNNYVQKNYNIIKNSMNTQLCDFGIIHAEPLSRVKLIDMAFAIQTLQTNNYEDFRSLIEGLNKKYISTDRLCDFIQKVFEEFQSQGGNIDILEENINIYKKQYGDNEVTRMLDNYANTS